jgi:pilus assembly protein CpaF
LEGVGEITIRHLLKNALRMRPDRIILGEVRGEEAVDMLQAMNTGHDGSMCTLHANSADEALVRLEHMVALAGTAIPSAALRQQIGGAVHLIVQVSRMQDGKRRMSQIAEVRGVRDGNVVVAPIFTFTVHDTDRSGAIRGQFECNGTPHTFLKRAAPFGLVPALKSLFK